MAANGIRLFWGNFRNITFILWQTVKETAWWRIAGLVSLQQDPALLPACSGSSHIQKSCKFDSSALPVGVQVVVKLCSSAMTRALTQCWKSSFTIMLQGRDSSADMILTDGRMTRRILLVWPLHGILMQEVSIWFLFTSSFCPSFRETLCATLMVLLSSISHASSEILTHAEATRESRS